MVKAATPHMISEHRTGDFHLTGLALSVHRNIQYEKNQCIGITRGGINSKIHAVVDALGNEILEQL